MKSFIICSLLLLSMPLCSFASGTYLGNVDVEEHPTKITDGVVQNWIVVEHLSWGQCEFYSTLSFANTYDLDDMKSIATKVALEYVKEINALHGYTHLLRDGVDCGYLNFMNQASSIYLVRSPSSRWESVMLRLSTEGVYLNDKPNVPERNNNVEVYSEWTPDTTPTSSASGEKPHQVTKKNVNKTQGKATKVKTNNIYQNNGSTIACEDAWICGANGDSVCYLKGSKGHSISLSEVDEEKTFGTGPR